MWQSLTAACFMHPGSAPAALRAALARAAPAAALAAPTQLQWFSSSAACPLSLTESVAILTGLAAAAQKQAPNSDGEEVRSAMVRGRRRQQRQHYTRGQSTHSAHQRVAHTPHRQRHLRKKDEDGGASARPAAKSVVQLEAESLARIEAAVAQRLAEALASDAFQGRVAARLKEERARLEAAMAAQLDVERAALLDRKRAAQEAARKAAEDLDRLLEENRWAG